MIRRRLGIIIVCAWLVACGDRVSGPVNSLPQFAAAPSLQQAGGGNDLPEPPVVRAVGGVARVALIVNENRSTGQPEFEFDRMRAVAPTIELNPGETLIVDLRNDLPKEPPPDATGPSPDASVMRDDVNLHFHGLGVSPQAPGDDVLTTLVRPGHRTRYVVHIPKNQEPGLYWYHPHVHGEANFQAGESGMSGAIVINGLEHHLPGLAKMKQRLIIVRAMGESGDADPMMDGMAPMHGNTNPCTSKDGLTVTLNGAHQPDISIAAGEKQFFRVVNATGHKTLRLNMDGGSGFQIIAIDGFALDTYHGTPPTLTESTITIPPAARAEFVVTGPASGHAKLRTLCYDSGPNGDADPYLYLAHIVAPKSRMGGDFSKAPLTVGSPLPDNVYTEALPAPSAKRLVVFSENNKPHFFINGKSFSLRAPPMFVVHTGTVEEWTVENLTQEIHDFHIHQIHFAVESVNGVKVAHPHWADSVIIPHRSEGPKGSPGKVVMLMDFRDPVIRGEFVFHCHILDHEDQGMMAKIEAL
ncbi:MAG TPA: multicopper oxidase domain-containing protein [Candidatus Binatia bacterium]|nr:multicopper oxidase domain-containing protein [Candidatus Binatia bacterium]